MSNDIWYLWDDAQTLYSIGDHYLIIRYLIDEEGDGFYVVQVITWIHQDSFLVDEKYYDEVK